MTCQLALTTRRVHLQAGTLPVGVNPVCLSTAVYASFSCMQPLSMAWMHVHTQLL